MSNTTNPQSTAETQTVGNQAGEYTGHAQHQAQKTESSLADKFEAFEKDLQATTNQAVKDGQEDVTESAATYLERALHLADTGLATAQEYVGAGKERLHQTQPPTGLAASLAATAASALDAAGGYLGKAHQKLHEQHPHHVHNAPSHHAVTTPAKPIGEALSDNVTAAQAAVQPHVDAAQAAVQPHVDSVVAAAQPYVDSAKQSAQPYVDSAKQTAQPYVDSAKEAAQPYVDSAKETAKPLLAGESQAGATETNPILERAQETHPSVEATKPQSEYPVESGSIPVAAAGDSEAAAASSQV